MAERVLLHTHTHTQNVIRGIFRYYSFVLPSRIVTFSSVHCFCFLRLPASWKCRKNQTTLKTT